MITDEERKEINEEIEATELMVKDLEKLWKSYAKKALEAKQERDLKQEKKGFLEYKNMEELIEGWGYGCISEETYEKGLLYFENAKKPPKLSAIERHRRNISNLIGSRKGTIIELKEELNPPEPVIKENIFEKNERLEREERYKALRNEDILSSLRGN